MVFIDPQITNEFKNEWSDFFRKVSIDGAYRARRFSQSPNGQGQTV